jgi:6,7-dimethyl-8-ribityllumazine synthase
MATMAGAESRPAATIVGGAEGLRVGLVHARWNEAIVSRLVDGAKRSINAHGAIAVEVSAPGAFELPFAAQILIESGGVDAVVVVGAVIRGDTTHYELVSEGCASGVLEVQLKTGKPIGFGVVTVENTEQALTRSAGPGGHNVGEEAAAAAIEMAVLAERLASP